MKIKRICRTCKKEFYVFPSCSNQKFCSRKCYHIYDKKHGLNAGKNNPMYGKYGRHHPNWKGGEVTKYCIICGKKFTLPECWIKRGRGLFCSRRCKARWVSENKSGENNWNWKDKIRKKCLICNKIFYVSFYESERGRGKFCSRECYGKWRSKNKSGKNNSNWRGGRKSLLYTSDWTEKLKRQIRKRDNYTCQECGQTEKELGYKLSVHHINYEKLDSRPENLISLCNSCHSQTNYKRKDWTKYFQGRLSLPLSGQNTV